MEESDFLNSVCRLLPEEARLDAGLDPVPGLGRQLAFARSGHPGGCAMTQHPAMKPKHPPLDKHTQILQSSNSVLGPDP